MKSDDATNDSESNGAERKEEGDKNGSDVRTEEAKEEEGDKNGKVAETGDKNGEGSDVRNEEASADASRPVKSISEVSVIQCTYT